MPDGIQWRCVGPACEKPSWNSASDRQTTNGERCTSDPTITPPWQFRVADVELDGDHLGQGMPPVALLAVGEEAEEQSCAGRHERTPARKAGCMSIGSRCR